VIERLWSGWRSAYVAGEAVDARAAFDSGADSASVFSQLLRSGLPDEETHIVHRGERCFAIMNAFPYTNGHLIVLPYREVPDLLDLDADETAELWATVTTAVGVVRRAFGPDGVNVGLNLGRASGGSVPTHLHVHVVPRWTGDTNFMSSIANTQTIPESLPVSARKVRLAWSESPLSGSTPPAAPVVTSGSDPDVTTGAPS
jgi:diadenosine tetraphosphate (Ap4A) HIT family hydrolase